MNDDKRAPMTARTFGDCCDQLQDAITATDFEPLITIGDDGILCAAIGLVEMEDGEAGMYDHPIFFCPFCGTKLQDPEVVEAQISSEGATQQ